MADACDCDLGYDPTVREPFPIEHPRLVDKLPPAAMVYPGFLPPIGQQGTTATEGSPGTCCAWAFVYGLATFTAARAGRVDPSHPAGRASPAQIYIEVLTNLKTTPGTCADTGFGDYLPILKESGTQSIADAPYVPDCPSLWLAYGTPVAEPREVFKIGDTGCVETSDLDSIKHVIASGRALAFGTRLFTDFSSYSGGSSPYWGNGDLIVSTKTNKPAGHCMLIIGYSDTTGAFLIQNSQGTVWGIGGYMWISYSTFQYLSQGQALYVKD